MAPQSRGAARSRPCSTRRVGVLYELRTPVSGRYDVTDQAIAKGCLAPLAAISLMCGCAAPPPKQPATPSTATAPVQTEETRRAMRAFIKCQIQHEPELDDKVSDASTSALGLTNRCSSEYEAETESWLGPNDSQHYKQVWREQRNTREAKIEASLDIVLSMRRGMVPNPNF